ncbi:MAG: TetR/AcrR family transcriptional regulator [Acidothermaceae bacterium]
MPKVSQEHRDARRAQILGAARRCFLRNGFHETSMQDLFAEAGLSSGAVYLYFASKEDVILAIAEENMRDVVAVIHELVTSRLQDGLGAALAEVLDVVQTKHTNDQLGGIAVLVWSEALRNPTVAKRLDESLQEMRTDLADVVRAHQTHGSTARDASPEALAALSMSIISGYLLQLTLFTPRVVATVPGAVRALWPT